MACEYCNGDRGLVEREHGSMSRKGDFYAGINVYIDEDVLSVDSVADVYEPNFTEVEIKINFCPMCGEKLEGKR